jgi:hypothetical protein
MAFKGSTCPLPGGSFPARSSSRRCSGPGIWRGEAPERRTLRASSAPSQGVGFDPGDDFQVSVCHDETGPAFRCVWWDTKGHAGPGGQTGQYWDSPEQAPTRSRPPGRCVYGNCVAADRSFRRQTPSRGGVSRTQSHAAKQPLPSLPSYPGAAPFIDQQLSPQFEGGLGSGRANRPYYLVVIITGIP